MLPEMWQSYFLCCWTIGDEGIMLLCNNVHLLLIIVKS